VALTTEDIFERFDEFQLPQQNLKELSFCGHKPRQLQKWLQELPVTQTKHVSVVFYKLLPELNHLNISGNQRIGLLEILRPFVQNCVNGLADEFIKQSLNLPEGTSKLAAISQALQRHLSDGYLIAVKQLLENKKFSEQELVIALYYATQGLGQLLYRSYQLYIPRPPLLWKKLNLLFVLAQQSRLHKQPIPDPSLETQRSISLERIYFRTLILACSNTNQLRQVDIQYLHRSLESWSALIKLRKTEEDDSSIYWIDLDSDEGPFYRARHQEDITHQIFTIDMSNLVDLISSYDAHAEGEQSRIEEIPIHVRQSLIKHLLTCWQEHLERQQRRLEISLDLEICIGLTAAHQHLINGMTFYEFLPAESHDSHITLEGSISFNSNQTSKESDQSPKYQVTATDISKNGFCLKWSDDVPTQVKSGEMVILREAGKEQWQMGTIRWAQRLNCHTYIGIQVMNGTLKAAAASATLDDGQDSPYFRALLLFEESETGSNSDKESLITPTVPFATQQDVRLYNDSRERKEIKLSKLVINSGSISQFRFLKK
jgi:hypothetical protein